jgi:hypothetical protein
MSDEAPQAPLVPLLEERRVDFYGDELIAVLGQHEGRNLIGIPLKPLCERIGITYGAQYNRVRRDEVLREGIFVMKIPSAGGEQSMVCLPLDLLPGWLFGISASRVKPALHEKIIRYQRECFRVLWEAFQPQIVPQPQPQVVEKSGAELAYEIATAVQHLARQQLEMEQRLDRASQWAHGINREVGDLRSRVDSLEVQVSGGAPISEQQAAEVALAVKNVGRALEAQGHKSGYSQVYAEMYRRYAISSYKNLPRERFDDVLVWLRQWYAEVAGEHSA